MNLITRSFFYKQSKVEDKDFQVLETPDLNRFLASFKDSDTKTLYRDDLLKMTEYVIKVGTHDINKSIELKTVLDAYVGVFETTMSERWKVKTFELDQFYQYPGDRDQGKLLVDKMVCAIIEETPVYYDKLDRFWMWFSDEYIWIETDETDIYNLTKRYIPDVDVYRKKAEMIFYFKLEGRKIAPVELPAHVILFNDYAYNIKNGDKILPVPDYFFKQRIPFTIGNAENDTPNIDKFIKSLCKTDEQEKQLWEIPAYCLIREQLLDKMFFFIGAGSNGKTTYINFLRRCLGADNCTSITSADITGKNAHGFTNCVDKLLIEWPEPTRYDLSSTTRFKQIVSGDFMQINPKNKEPYEVQLYGKLISPTNALPQTADKTDGFYRRIIHILFEKKFTNKDSIPDISDEEISDFWAKCLVKSKKIIDTRDLSVSLEVDEIRNIHEQLSNPVSKFVSEEMEQESGCNIPYWLFKELFLDWAAEKGFGMFDEKEIKLMLANIGIHYGDMERKQFWLDHSTRWDKVWRWINGYKIKKTVLQKIAIKRLNKNLATQKTQYLLISSKLFDYYLSNKFQNTVLSVLQKEKTIAEEQEFATQQTIKTQENNNYDKFLLLIINNKEYQIDDLYNEFQTQYFSLTGSTCDHNQFNECIDNMKHEGLIFEPRHGVIKKV